MLIIYEHQWWEDAAWWKNMNILLPGEKTGIQRKQIPESHTWHLAGPRAGVTATWYHDPMWTTTYFRRSSSRSLISLERPGYCDRGRVSSLWAGRLRLSGWGPRYPNCAIWSEQVVSSNARMKIKLCPRTCWGLARTAGEEWKTTPGHLTLPMERCDPSSTPRHSFPQGSVSTHSTWL